MSLSLKSIPLNWKTALIGSVMTLASQSTAMANNKPLPCPTNSPLVDSLGVVQQNTKQKIENRLRSIDSEKHHQVVVVTVDNTEEYGYGSIEQMANAIGNECKVGYRGENTGVVVLYTKNPSRYRIETANTERYITDAASSRILSHSKSNGVCEKSNVDCRLNDITDGIDKIIRAEFKDQNSVQQLKDSTKKHDEQKVDREISEFLNTAGISAVVIVVLGGGFVGGRSIINSSRRRSLKRQIFELSIKYKKEITKYPEWFINKYTKQAQEALEELEGYNNEDLDRFIHSSTLKENRFDRKISMIEATISGLELKFLEINLQIQSETSRITEKIVGLGKLQESLKSEGFKFKEEQIPTIKEGSNADETLSILNNISNRISKSWTSLMLIPDFYKTNKGLELKVQEEYRTKKEKYLKTKQVYENIFGTNSSIDLQELGKTVNSFVSDFQVAYKEKNISKIEEFVSKEKNIFGTISNSTESMIREIEWYNQIPEKIKNIQHTLNGLSVKSQYKEDAKKYAQKTRKTKFLDYDMGASLVLLQQLIKKISENHSQKKNLGEVNAIFSKITSELNNISEYIGLGAALSAIIAEEIAEAKRAEQRRIDEERRRQREEENRRRRRREEEEESSRRSSRSSSSSGRDSGSSSSSWDSGGGGGFDGGGSSSD